MTHVCVLRVGSQDLSASPNHAGNVCRDRDRETMDKERRKEGRRKRMRRSSNSCATVQSVGTLYAYMSVQARRTRSAKGGQGQERVWGERRLQVRVVLIRKICGAWDVIFFRAWRAFVRLLCGWEVKFVVYYRALCGRRAVNRYRSFDAPRRTEGVRCPVCFCYVSFRRKWIRFRNVFYVRFAIKCFDTRTMLITTEFACGWYN